MPTPPSSNRHQGVVTLRRGCELGLIVIFLAALAIPGLATIAGVDRDIAEGENRELAHFPAAPHDWQALRAFPDGFTRYFEDHFAFRARFVRWQAALRYQLLDVSPTPAVVKGRDGWLFYADDDALADYTTERPLTQAELEQWRLALEHTRQRLAVVGVTFVFVTAPAKHAIYPEFMPPGIRRLREESRSDQLAAYLAAHSTVIAVDLRPVLLQHKHDERLYQRTDTHWNDRGAFVAYQQIIRALQPVYPELHPASRSEFEAREVRTRGLDLAGMMGLTSTLHEDDLILTSRHRRARTIEPLHPDPHGIEGRLVTEIPGAALPRLLVFRDSFGSALIPFLSEHFSRAVYLWQNYLDFDVIAKERPDIVIQEWVGRRLTTLPPYDPGPPTDK
jgi:alginate O-acetyltransferase complex protein AlgJ